jgi:hypothetical protein
MTDLSKSISPFNWIALSAASVDPNSTNAQPCRHSHSEQSKRRKGKCYPKFSSPLSSEPPEASQLPTALEEFHQEVVVDGVR